MVYFREKPSPARDHLALIRTLLRLFAQNSLVCARVRTHETKSIIRRVRLSGDYFTIEKWAGGADPPVVILII